RAERADAAGEQYIDRIRRTGIVDGVVDKGDVLGRAPADIEVAAGSIDIAVGPAAAEHDVVAGAGVELLLECLRSDKSGIVGSDDAVIAGEQRVDKAVGGERRSQVG